MADAPPRDEAPPLFSVLIVTHKNPELTRTCLASVFEQTRDAAFEVVVLDSASDDGTPDMIAAEFRQVRLIRCEENVGFAAGNNIAARAARGEYLVLLNPDTVVLDRALEKLVAFGQAQGGDALVGGRTLAPGGALDPKSCWGAQSPWSLFCFATGLSTAFKDNRVLDPESLGRWARDSVRDVGYITGCLLLCRRAVWEQLGGFDERFFMYGEDADLSFRAREAGHRTCITPDATIVHHVGKSSDRSGLKMSAVMRGRATLVREHFPRPLRAFGIACLLGGVGLRAALTIAVRRIRGRGGRGCWVEVWARRGEWRPGY